MKKWLFPLVLLLILPTLANNDAFVLYSLDADIDGDKVAERLLIVSKEGSDPAKMGPKTLMIMKRSGDRFKTVFTDSFTAAFFTKCAPFQWQGVENAMAGITLRKVQGQKYPGVWVVFTPNSSDLVSYTFDGKKFTRDEIPDGI